MSSESLWLLVVYHLIGLYIVLFRRQRAEHMSLWGHIRGHVECVVWAMMRQRVDAVPVEIPDRREALFKDQLTSLHADRLARLRGTETLCVCEPDSETAS